MSDMAIYRHLVLPWCLLSRECLCVRKLVATIVLKRVGSLLFVSALLLAAAFTYSTAHGYMTWWFSSSAAVAVDGVRGGYLHRNWEHPAVIITRVDSHP